MWTGKRSEFEIYLKSILKDLGFSLGNNTWQCKKDAPKKWYYVGGGNNIEFACGFNSDYSGQIFGQIPLSFWCNYPEEGVSLPEMGSLDFYRIIPGLVNYVRFGRETKYAMDAKPDPTKSLITGIEAIAFAYKALAESLES